MMFVLCYYVVQAILAAYDNQATAELNEQYFGSNQDGIYYMFVAITTAIHPDVWMPMDNHAWYLMFVLLAIMCSMNVILLNVVLAVVGDCYSRNLTARVKRTERIAHHTLKHVFRRAMKHVLVRKPDCTGICFELLSKMLELSGHTKKEIKVWTQLIDLEEGGESVITEDEFIKLYAMSKVPLVPIDHFDKQMDDPQNETFVFPLLHNIVTGKANIVGTPTYESLHSTHAELRRHGRFNGETEVESADDKTTTGAALSAEARVKDIKYKEMIGRMTSYPQLVIIVNLVFLLLPAWQDHFPTRAEVQRQRCSDTYPTVYWFVFWGLTLVEVILSMLAHAVNGYRFKYTLFISPHGDCRESGRLPSGHQYTNFITVVYFVVLSIALLDVCSDGTTTNYTVILGVIQAIKCVLFPRVYKGYSRTLRAIGKCLGCIVPHLNVFLVVFYAFAALGLSLFAGCVTENAPEGPGDWTGAEWAGLYIGR